MSIGRPTEYNPEINEQVFKLCLLGATDEQIADFFGVSRATISNWKNKYPDFLDTLKRGKLGADAEAANSLYQRVLSGDTTACIIWLKNRQRNLWGDKPQENNTDGLAKGLADAVQMLKTKK